MDTDPELRFWLCFCLFVYPRPTVLHLKSNSWFYHLIDIKLMLHKRKMLKMMMRKLMMKRTMALDIFPHRRGLFRYSASDMTQFQYWDAMLRHFLKKPWVTWFLKIILPYFTNTSYIHTEYYKNCFWLISDLFHVIFFSSKG